MNIFADFTPSDRSLGVPAPVQRGCNCCFVHREAPWDARSHGGFSSPSANPYPKLKPEPSRAQGPDAKLTTHKPLPAPALLSLRAFENLGKTWAPPCLLFLALNPNLSLRLAVFLNQVWLTWNGLLPVLRVALFLFPHLWIRESRTPPRRLFLSPTPKPHLKCRPD